METQYTLNSNGFDLEKDSIKHEFALKDTPPSPSDMSVTLNVPSYQKPKVKRKKRVTIMEIKDVETSSEKPYNCEPITSCTHQEVPSWLKLGNVYKGYCPFRCAICSPGTSIVRIPYTSITPENFYEQFVIKRTPCILTTDKNSLETHPGLKEFKNVLCQWTRNSYLRKASGFLTVDVEYAKEGDERQKFGHGCRKKMTFSKFLDSLKNEKEEYYMTTQKATAFHLGNPILTTTSLASDFPPVPSLLKTLCPSEYNLWFGNSRKEISSGLHHDFHDNLYILIRGRKKFRLFSPRCAELIGVSQPIHHIHENGLITYTPHIRSDGFPESLVMKWKLFQTRQQGHGLQERLGTVEEAIKLLRTCARSLDQTHPRNIEGCSRIVVPSRKLRRFKKRGTAMTGQKIRAGFCNPKLSTIVSQGFYKKLCKVKLKHAKALLEQEIRSRKESMNLLKYYIEQNTEKCLDLQLQYENLKDLMELEQGPLNDEDNDDNFSESGHEEEFMQENYCVTSLPKSNKMFQKKGPFGINELYGKASSLDIIEKSLSEKDQQVLCEEKKKNALAKQNLQKEKLTDTDFLSFMDEEQLLEKNEILEDLEEEEEDFDEDTIFIDSFMQNMDGEEEHPAHFCLQNTIDRNETLHEFVYGRFPKMSEGIARDMSQKYPHLSLDQIALLQSYIELELNPGDMLYLPAGWFHEVFSFPSTMERKISTVKKTRSKKSIKGHMALNYWFHPPHVGPCDGHETYYGTYENPYQDGFCFKRYQRLEAVRAQLQNSLDFSF